MAKNFGSGDLVLIPNTTNPTPVMFNALQDISVDIKFDKKVLHGQKQFPIAVARGKGSIDIKFKDAEVNGAMFNSVFFGDTASVGQLILAVKETGTIPAASTYTITVDNDATFVLDCGVHYFDSAANTIKAWTRVASAPAAGEYSVAAGVYTFAVADANKTVLISYTYTTTSGGTTTTLTNKNMGSAPQFKAIYSTSFEGKRFTIQLNACQSDDLKLAAKNEDYMIPEITASAFADAAGNVGIVSLVD
jgi:hypothetical protein